MAEYNLEELSKSSTTRPQLEEVAVSLGLVDAKTYTNKPAVLEAIKRVDAGEDAAVVNDELKVVDESTPPANTDPSGASNVSENADDDESDDDADDDANAAQNASNAPTRKKPVVKNRNQGHPTAFDETGRPVYR